MRTLILILAVGPSLADTLIIPTIPGTSLLDYSQPGMRVEDGVIYETYPGPLGIINPMGTTYVDEGDALVPHQGILGPQDFTEPSYVIERTPTLRDLGYGRPMIPYEDD